MAAGRPPSPDGPARRRDAARRLGGAGVPLSAGGQGDVWGPELPDAGRLSERTKDWYATWRRAPQAADFTVTDWQRLHMVAELVDRYFDAPSHQLLAEIRLNEEKLGATAMDRMRLGYRTPKAQPDALDPARLLTDPATANRFNPGRQSSLERALGNSFLEKARQREDQKNGKVS